MNKQEAIERIESNALNIGDNDLVVGLNVAKHIINQIDEQQKPVVPKFVAEYIEYCKHEKFYALHGAYANMDDRLKCWRFKGNNIELFAKAWLYGYEVEKEKLYTARIKKLEECYGECYINQSKKTGEILIDDLDEVDGFFKVYFTKEELEKLELWDNVLIEVKEV